MRKLLLIALILVLASMPVLFNVQAKNTPEQAFKSTMNQYVLEFLRHNPTVNTYLGGAGLDPSLREADGRLRDHSVAALEAEDRWLGNTFNSLEQFDPQQLSVQSRIDREVALAQISFLMHQHQVRRYQERALDTYTDEPFRAIDWQLQGMTQTGEKTYGTPQEWELVAKRLGDIPRYLKVAQEQLLIGIKNDNSPDYRMLRRNGINTAEADAKYFTQTLPALAQERLAPGPQREALLTQINKGSAAAATAYQDLSRFVTQTFFDDAKAPGNNGVKPPFRKDRFAMGEDEYNWALKNNLRLTKNAGELYEEAWPIVQNTRKEMAELARKIGQKHGWQLPEDGNAAVRKVFEELSKDYPKSDAQMVDWYKDAAFRLVAYARKTGIFDVPKDYQLEVVETPPPLRASIDGAAYYPAPPFKNSGVGRYYVSPTDNDVAALKANNRSALADLSAHEGFPGHDWNYKLMTKFREQISGVRWLTPGAVEDSSSMWQDSLASEGWALYSEALMAEPQPGFPNGFYTDEEHLYQLRGKLYRDLRVRVDTGIHTNRLTYPQAVDLFSEVVSFMPGSCSDSAALANDDKRASCDSAEKAIFRYSKWPTQAITYRLGKDQIVELRAEATKILGKRFSPQSFHLLFMQYGTIPPGYFKEDLLRKLKTTK